MRILFLGENKGQPLGMQRALQRRGHEVVVVNPYELVQSHTQLARWAFHTGALLLSNAIFRRVKSQTFASSPFDVVFVDNGELVSRDLVQYLSTRARKVVLFNRDNPFSARDGFRWRLLRTALPFYDLFVTPRESTASKASRHGARRVLQVNFFADELLHQPRRPSENELKRFQSPVSFVGTWFPERGPFMQVLIDRGVPIRIIGNKWHRAKNWARLQPYVTAGYLSREDYAGAVLSCDIAIAMLSKGNEDVVTSRSMEIPALGKLLCAERTVEHQRLYREGEEAVFWSTPAECADTCLSLLANRRQICSLAEAGRKAAERNGNWSEPVMQRILDAVIAESCG